MPVVLSRGRTAAIALALALTPGVVWSAPVSTEAKAKATSPAEKLKKDLDQVISIEVAEQPLNLAINQLREQTKINFVIDRFTLAQFGLDPETATVNVKLKDVKTRSALRSMLSPYNLGFAIIGDTVLISSDDVAMYRQMRQRISVDFEKVELAQALKQLSKDTAANIMIDNRVTKEAKGEVTFQVEDVPLETAVRLMTEMAGLKPVRVGNVLFVTSKATANELKSDPDLGQPNPNQPQPGIMLPGGGMVFPGGIGIGGGGTGAGPVPAEPALPPEKTDPDKPAEKPAEKPTPDKPKDDKPKDDKPAPDKPKDDKPAKDR